MAEVKIEQISTDKKTLSRSCIIKIGNRSMVTPTRAVGVTSTKRLELDAAAPYIKGKNATFGEAYGRLSIDVLDSIINDKSEKDNESKDNDKIGKNFSTKMAARLTQLKEAGCIPYLIIQFTDENGNPYNKLPSDKVLNLLFDFLWGTDGNSIIIPPLMGALSSEKEYVQFINRLEERKNSSIDRKDLPIIAVIPPVYRLVAPDIVERYWKIGCRIFALDFENKKLGAYGYIIERLHSTLSTLSKQDGESYALHALNSKQRIGRGNSMRTNELLTPGYGFDSYGPAHFSRQRWIPDGKPIPAVDSNYLLNTMTYGFYPFSCLGDNDIAEKMLESKALSGMSLDNLSFLKTEEIKNACVKHNVEMEIKEVQAYAAAINSEELLTYYSKKSRIKDDIAEMASMADKGRPATIQSGLDKWFA